MARAIVVGAAGMLGREVAAALAAGGVDVVPTTRGRRTGWLTFDAERDDVGVLSRADLVVNCAAVLSSEADSDPARTRLVNAELPHRLAATGAPLVHISTDAVFRDDAGRCYEDDRPDPSDAYGSSKRDGEPDTDNAITLRCSFVGRDPERGRGLVEWLLSQARGARVGGFVDQTWNGLVSTQVASVCAALADRETFARARAEGGVHHLFEDPPLAKLELVRQVVAAFGLPLEVDARASGRPLTRLLGTRHHVLAEHLESGPGRATALADLARRRHTADG